jgi:hypothetical protein
VRTFRRRRQLHPPKPFFFSLYTQRFAPSIFCFVIRPVTVEVGKRTVKEGAGSCGSKKKKKEKKGDDVNGTNCKNQYLCMWYRFSQLVCKKKKGVGSAVVSLTSSLPYTKCFFSFLSFSFYKKINEKDRTTLCDIQPRLAAINLQCHPYFIQITQQMNVEKK